MGRLSELIEEQGTVRRETVIHSLGLGTRSSSARRTCKRHPEWGAATFEQGDRGGAHRRSRVRPAIRGPRRDEPRPGALSGEALCVKPGRLILRDASRKDLCLPGVCRRLKTLQRCERRRQCIRSLQPRLLRHLLPCKQEPEEIPRRDGLDLGAQTL